MLEARRLALIRRQALIAKVARRQALVSLAEALDAETRSAALAERSRQLVAASTPKLGTMAADVFAARAVFTASLVQLAGNAADAATDAARQSAWQADTLAQAETRAKRLAEREGEARAALAAVRLRRAEAEAPLLARKLHTKPQA